MPIKEDTFNKIQVRLTSAVESVRASLEPYGAWIEQMLSVPLRETLTLEVESNPGDAVAEELLQGLPVVSPTKARNSSWRAPIESWSLPPDLSPRIALSLQRERQPKAQPLPVWELDWQDCPVAFKFRGLSRQVISVKIPTVFPPGEMPMLSHFALTTLVHHAPRGCAQSPAVEARSAGQDRTLSRKCVRQDSATRSVRLGHRCARCDY
jgi:hypothetical protein